MDIKNILNDSDRRIVQQPSPSYDDTRNYPLPSIHSQSLTSVEPVRPPQPAQYTYHPQPPARRQQLQPHQIVYTGPVYQLPPPLPPPVEVRHMGNTIQYRYAPYPYEDSHPVDYVYQDYSQVPRQPPRVCEYRYETRPVQLQRQQTIPQQFHPQYQDTTRDSVHDQPTEHVSERHLNVHRNSYPKQDPYVRRDSYPRHDAYARHDPYAPHDSYAASDPLVSRVVPVDGGFEYRPAPQRSRQAVNNARYSADDHHQTRYESPSRYQSAHYIPTTEERHRHGRRQYKRPRSELHDDAEALPSRSLHEYPSTRLPNVTRAGSTSSQDTSEAAETARYTILKSEYRENASPRHQHVANSEATQTDEESILTRKNVKVEHEEVRANQPPKTIYKTKRQRAKNAEILSENDHFPRRSHHAADDSADNLSVVTMRRPRHSKSSAVDWLSDENVNMQTPSSCEPLARKSNAADGTALKKRQIFKESDSMQRDDNNRQRFQVAPTTETVSREYSEASSASRKVKRRPKKEPKRSQSVTDRSRGIQMESNGNRKLVELPPLPDSDVGEKADVESVGAEKERSLPVERIKVRSKSSKPRVRQKRRVAPPKLDPEEPYPQTAPELMSIPSRAVGDLLQVWDFTNSFAKTLRLTPFKLHHLQQAVVHPDRCSLLDACILRLVQTIVSDKGLIDELNIPESVVKAVNTKHAKNATSLILSELPNILAFESDDNDVDMLQETVTKLESSNRMAFYKILRPEEKLRIIRELVDYATMADHIRACVSDSMEHAEDEKKKAREENSSNRKKLESQIRELRTELLEYKRKHGMLESSSAADSDRGVEPIVKENGMRSETVSTSSDREESMSRKEKVLAAQRERREQEERRVKERGAEAIVARMDKVKANLKTLKNIRLRNRKDGDERGVFGPGSTVAIEELYEDPVRSYPLGTDRNHNCYWFFQGSGRVWVEMALMKEWYSFNEIKSINGLLNWLSPHRREEQALKKNITQRLDLIEHDMLQEKKCVEQAEVEMKEAEAAAEAAPRTTRAGKRKATQVKTNKKSVLTFLDYRNAER